MSNNKLFSFYSFFQQFPAYNHLYPVRNFMARERSPLNLDSERIPRHAVGLTARVGGRTTKNMHFSYLRDSLHLGAESFPKSV